MNLDDLATMAKELKLASKRDVAVESMLNEASTALADILSHLESSGPALAKALAAALSGVQLQVKAGASTINVSPTPVEIKVAPSPVAVNVAASPVAVNVAASPVAVNVMPASSKGAQWRVDVEREDFTGQMQSFTITRL